jgi:protein O-mannosyl-transferase
MKLLSDSNRRLLVYAGLAVLTLFSFSPVINGEFLDYDDQDYVTENAQVAHGLSWDGIRWAFQTGHAGNWHPLTWISHMVDCQLFGLNPQGHHCVNLAIHLMNVLLLFLVLERMTNGFWQSAFVAALFACHPLRVESVAWVAERKDLLSGFFFLASLWAYYRYASLSRIPPASNPTTSAHSNRPPPLTPWLQPDGPKPARGAAGSTASQPPAQSPVARSNRPGSGEAKVPINNQRLLLGYYGLTLGFFALGLMSKPMLVTLPFVLLLLDFWPLQRVWFSSSRSHSSVQTASHPPTTVECLRALTLEKVPFFALALLSSIITFLVQKTGGAMTLMVSVPLGTRLANSLIAYATYLRRIFWPSNLAAFYPFPDSVSTASLLAAIAVLVVATVLALANFRRRPYLTTGWLWFLGMLVPVIGVVQVGYQSMADRYTYLPAIGAFIAFTWLAADLVSAQPDWHMLTGIVAAMGIGLCSLGTWHQSRYWQNTETLFEHALAITSNNAIAEYQVGVAQLRRGDYENALSHFEAAVRIQPAYASAHNNLGLLLVMQGKVDEGLEHYRLAQRLKLDTAELYFNLGAALSAQGKLDEAAQAYRSALSRNSGLSTAAKELAVVLTRQGKLEEAIAQFRSVLKQNPDAESHYNLGLALALNKRSKETIAEYREALRLRPDFPQALNDLAWILATDPDPNLRNGQEAVQLAEQACQLTQRRQAQFLGTLDAGYAELGNYAEALATAREAIALARKANQPQVVQAAQERTKLYLQGLPYRQP